MSNINNRMKIIRQELNLTQKKLAETIGIKWYQIKDIETGKTKPSINIVSSMCEKFAIDSLWLLTGKNNVNRTSKQKDKINNNFKSPDKGQSVINALIEIESINEQIFRRTVADIELIAEKLKEGGSPGPLISITGNKNWGELKIQEKDNT